MEKEEGILKQAYYMFLLVTLSVGYFIYAIAEGLWGLVKGDKK